MESASSTPSPGMGNPRPLTYMRGKGIKPQGPGSRWPGGAGVSEWQAWGPAHGHPDL